MSRTTVTNSDRTSGYIYINTYLVTPFDRVVNHTYEQNISIHVKLKSPGGRAFFEIMNYEK